MSQGGGEAAEGKEGPSQRPESALTDWTWLLCWGGGSPGGEVAHFSEFCATEKAFKSNKRALKSQNWALLLDHSLSNFGCTLLCGALSRAWTGREEEGLLEGLVQAKRPSVALPHTPLKPGGSF